MAPLPGSDGGVVVAVVGSLVRVSLPNHPKARSRRAIVATVQEEEGTVCVIWEDEAPRPLAAVTYEGGSNLSSASSSSAKNASTRRTFLVAPVIMEDATTTTADEEIEATVPLSDVSPLLEFEIEESNEAVVSSSLTSSTSSVKFWKDRGDALLRLGDASSAVPYYERALQLSSTISVGATVLFKEKGRAVLAEVDCVESNTVDVSLLVESSGGEEERTLRKSEVLLCLSEESDTDGSDNDRRLQERILLNLARCLMQLAETTARASRQPDYLRGAVRATTYAATVASYHDDNNKGSTNNNCAAGSSAANNTNTQTTALLIRSRAQTALSRFPHAISDLKRLLALDPQHKEGIRFLKEVERQQLLQQKTDKKLAKDVCRWVSTATAETGADADDGGGSAVSEGDSASVEGPSPTPESNNTSKRQVQSHTTSSSFSGGWFFLAFLAGALAWLYGKRS